MRLHELGPAQSIRNELFGGEKSYNAYATAIEKLADFGFKSLGSGFRGTVFHKPNLPYVLKLFFLDYGYITFLQYAMQHQSNPHLPKFRGKTVRIIKDVYAIRMEKLSELREKTPGGIISTYYDKWRLGRLNDYDNTKNKMDLYSKEYALLFKTLGEIYQLTNDPKYNYNIAFDMHGSNMMKRKDGTLVITDPLV